MAKQAKKPTAPPAADLPAAEKPKRNGAPKGNEFWKLRSKHGCDKLFASPELLWEAACEYFQWCIDNPLIEVDYKGKDAKKVRVPKMRPFTLGGLALYCHAHTLYFTQFKDDLKKKDDKTSRAFYEVVTRIYDTIYQQKFEGAAAGFLNPNIIARDLGLVEKTESKANVTIEEEIDYEQLSTEALREIAQAKRHKGNGGAVQA